MRKTKGVTFIDLMCILAIMGIIAAIAIPNIIEAKARTNTKKEPPRFEFSEDIGPEEVYAYLVKDTLTKKQFLIVNKHGGTVALDVTPTAEKKE